MKFEKAVAELRAIWDGTDPLLRETMTSALRAIGAVVVREGPVFVRACPENLKNAALSMFARLTKEEFSPFGMGGEVAFGKLLEAFPEVTAEVTTWLKSSNVQ